MDYSDEDDCRFRCRELICDNGRCIRHHHRCDECLDGSDEEGCDIIITTTPCPGFICHDIGKCIPADSVCDGAVDCLDWSDETNCPNCEGFECPNSKRCISDSFICDGYNDCEDGADEDEKVACPCAENEFRCPRPPGSIVPGDCIPEEYVCDEDGLWDCFDGSDEANCTYSSKLHVPRYRKRKQ